MGMMGGRNSEGMLLGRTDVQKDLKLTDEQKSKLEALRAEMQAKFQAFRGPWREGGPGGPPPPGGTVPPPPPAGAAGVVTPEQFNPEAMRTQMEAVQKEVTEKTKAILTEEQWSRLGQIKIQIAGPRIVMDDDEVGKKVGVKASQKLEINKIIESLNQANGQIFAKLREPNADQAALTKEIEKNNQILSVEIKKIFTPDQSKAYETLEGPKFEADPQYSQMRFGGAGGQGRRGGGGGGGGG